MSKKTSLKPLSDFLLKLDFLSAFDNMQGILGGSFACMCICHVEVGLQCISDVKALGCGTEFLLGVLRG